jgi:hypothetical protein
LCEEAEGLGQLNCADKMVEGLAGEFTRWLASTGNNNSALVKVALS